MCHFAAGRAGDTDTLSSLQLCAVHVRVERVELGLRDAVGCPDGVAGLAILHCDHLGACGPSLGAHCLANLHSQRRDVQVNNLLEAMCGPNCYGMPAVLDCQQFGACVLGTKHCWEKSCSLQSQGVLCMFCKSNITMPVFGTHRQKFKLPMHIPHLKTWTLIASSASDRLGAQQ